MAGNYVLNADCTVRPVADVIEWATAFEKGDRRVALTDLGGGVKISTVFLGIDHSFGEGPPLIFETMVFANRAGEEAMWRYSTWAEAEAGHARAVELTQQRIDAGEPIEGIDADAPRTSSLPAVTGGD